MMELEKLREQAGEASKLLGAMANQKRLMIMCHLLQHEYNVSEIAGLVKLEQSPLSQHLAKLRDQGLVATRRKGQSIYYRLASPEVEAIILTLYDIYCAPTKD